MKYNLIVFAVSCFLFISCGEEIKESKLPSVVKNTLKAKHPLAANVDWEKRGNTYEAEFVLQGRETSVKIEETGDYLVEKLEVMLQELPASIVSAVGQSYKNFVIDETDKLVANGATYYRVELEARGKEDIKLVLLDNRLQAPGLILLGLEC